MIDVNIDVENVRDGLRACEAITALLQGLIGDRKELELGKDGVFGLFLLLNAERNALARLGAADTTNIRL